MSTSLGLDSTGGSGRTVFLLCDSEPSKATFSSYVRTCVRTYVRTYPFAVSGSLHNVLSWNFFNSTAALTIILGFRAPRPPSAQSRSGLCFIGSNARKDLATWWGHGPLEAIWRSLRMPSQNKIFKRHRTTVLKQKQY